MADTITTAGATPAEWARLACSEAAQYRDITKDPI